jgi:hypothetical protein
MTTPTKRTTKTRKPKARKAARADTASVVPADFRASYAEHGGSCGDDLAQRLKKHLTATDGTTDLDKLRALAELNGLWRSDYGRLNPGLQRLNVGNRLRALVRQGTKVKWGQS